jgi:hypothetical protein
MASPDVYAASESQHQQGVVTLIGSDEYEVPADASEDLGLASGNQRL